jgi:integrase
MKWIRLSDNYGEALQLWAQYEGEAYKTGETVGAALDRYLIEVLPQKSPRTQRDYLAYAVNLRRIFGDTHLTDIRPMHIAQYLDISKAKVQANRQISMLSSVISHAMRWGWCDKNPCRGVRRNKERPRDRHVTDAEIKSLCDAADVQVCCIIDLVLITGLRKGDVLAIKLSDLSDAGLEIRVSKTGKRIIFEWTSELRAIINRCRSLKRRIGSFHLFCNRKGQAYTISGFDSIWQRVVKRAGATGVHFHDLRARAITDAKKQGGIDYAQALAAHDSASTTERYIRGREVVKIRPVAKLF